MIPNQDTNDKYKRIKGSININIIIIIKGLYIQ